MTNDQLFFKVFRNIYLNKLIFENVILLNKNLIVSFETRIEMKTYKYRDFIDTLIYKSQEKLEFGDLPTNGVLRVIKVPTYLHLNSSLNTTTIPYGVEELWLSNLGSIDLNQLPSSITSINNYCLENTFKNDVGWFISSPTIYVSAPELIPNNIQSLSISKRSPFYSLMNNVLNLNLNKTLTSLDLGHLPNKGEPLGVNVLPINLKRLIIKGYYLPITLKGQLPNTLEELEIGSHTLNFFDESSLPESLKSLSVDFLKIPLGSKLELNSNNIKNVENLSISSLSHSTLIFKLFSLPNNLKILKCSNFETIDNQDNIDYRYPKSLKELHYSGTIHPKFPRLPPNLESLSFIAQKFNDTLPPLPPNLKTLKLGPMYNRKLKVGFLPNSLEHLILGIGFNHPFQKGSLPCNLKSLIFPLDSRFTYVFDRAGILPNTLTTLIIPLKSKLDLSESSSDIYDPIPKSVKHLKFV
ncbi:hypothetical protein ACTA71_001120 [Dictyostelium dimigraforme]